jgi:ATP-dependent exoDNAse (exonuclease V) beta subunit
MHVSHDLPVRAVSAREASSPQAEVLPGMERVVEPGPGAPPTIELTDEQRQAVARRAEALALSAAAGSGKTSVLVERFVRAVREDGIAPARILAITFTERAAGELRARVRARLLELGDREAARDTEAAFVGTFHGFCARLLRTHPLAAGLDPGFTIIDEGLAGRLRELAFTDAVREFLEGERPEAVDLLAAYGIDRVRSMVEQVHAELRSRGQRLPRLPAAAGGEQGEVVDIEAAGDCRLLDELLGRFGGAFERLKAARAAVDFDDLELIARELLTERESLRRAWSERFELLMVDEFQDTNPRQLGILRALDRGNLFTVGDEFQSIYGFRHADVSLFRARRAELAERGASLALTRNFRSREPLLQVVNAVFAERFDGYVPLVAGRFEAPARGSAEPPGPLAQGAGEQDEAAVELLLTDMGGWEQREELVAAVAAGLPYAQPWRQAEARMLARRVAELVEGGHARAGDVVVLLRASGDLEVYERALQLCGLRTLAAVGAFWRHQQIGDLVSYLRALANPLDEESLYAALASPLGGCSRDCLALLAQDAAQQRRGVWATAVEAVMGGAGELLAGLRAEDRDALRAFCVRLQQERRTASRRTISELIERVIDARGYREYVLALDWGERRLANVHKLLRLARRFEAGEGRDLRGFLDHVEHLTEAVKVEPDAPVEGVEPDAVRLMTVHAAKGLEFPVVCLADLGRQPNTQTPGLLVDGDRIGLRHVPLDGAESTPALDYEELCQERRQREAEEEDRILYVAMTRARERLLLSGAVEFERWPASRQAAPAISWLARALAANLAELLMAGQAPPEHLDVGSVGVRLHLNTAAGAVQTLLAPVPAATPPAGVVDPMSADPRPAQGAVPIPDGPASGGPEGLAGRSPGEVASGHERIAALSYTSLSELERCGYRYYLERVLGLGEDRSAARPASAERGLEARARGTLVHRLMESLDFALPRPPSPGEVTSVARAMGLRVGEGERAEIARMIDAASRVGLLERVAAAATVRREYPFAFALAAQQPLITGVIDLLARAADGSCLVVDYKSDRVAPGVELAGLVTRDYGVQRLLYALAVLREGAPEVEIVHWFLERPEEWVSAAYTAAERPALERELAGRIARAQERRFAVSPAPHRGLCLTCPGRTGLCSWDEAHTLREDPENTSTVAHEP